MLVRTSSPKVMACLTFGRVTCVMLIALVGFMMPAYAEEVTLDVTIVKIEDGKLFVNKEGKEHNAPVAKNAKITIDGKDKSMSDLKADMKCKMTIEKGDGKITVTKVEAKSGS